MNSTFVKKIIMKKKNTLFWLGFAATATVTAILITRAFHHSKRLNEIADEGYETAADILFPETPTRKRKVHYGPVLPENEEVLNG